MAGCAVGVQDGRDVTVERDRRARLGADRPLRRHGRDQTGENKSGQRPRQVTSRATRGHEPTKMRACMLGIKSRRTLRNTTKGWGAFTLRYRPAAVRTV